VIAAHMCVFDAAEEKLSSKLFTIFHVLLGSPKTDPEPRTRNPESLSPIPYPLSPIPYPLSPNP